MNRSISSRCRYWKSDAAPLVFREVRRARFIGTFERPGFCPASHNARSTIMPPISTRLAERSRIQAPPEPDPSPTLGSDSAQGSSRVRRHLLRLLPRLAAKPRHRYNPATRLPGPGGFRYKGRLGSSRRLVPTLSEFSDCNESRAARAPRMGLVSGRSSSRLTGLEWTWPEADRSTRDGMQWNRRLTRRS